MRRDERFPVEPLPEGRWDRIERRLFDALERERAGEGARTALRPRRAPWAWRWPVPAAFVVGAAVAAALVLVALRRPETPAGGRPVRVVAAAGSRLEIGDARVLVGAGTDVVARTEADGTVRLVLARGEVDCDVSPRPGRAPFFVEAGDVTVRVVGTRFVVANGDDVTVRVARGQVEVRTADGATRALAAGEAWARSGRVLAAGDAALASDGGVDGAAGGVAGDGASGDGVAGDGATGDGATGTGVAALGEGTAGRGGRGGASRSGDGTVKLGSRTASAPPQPDRPSTLPGRKPPRGGTADAGAAPAALHEELLAAEAREKNDPRGALSAYWSIARKDRGRVGAQALVDIARLALGRTSAPKVALDAICVFESRGYGGPGAKELAREMAELKAAALQRVPGYRCRR